MSLTLTVHRGTQQIGGSCIEVAAADGARLILDAGRPLDAPKEAAGLLPATLDLSRPAHVLVSHPHMDHWGLLGELPGDWPVWTGDTAARLIRLTAALFAMPVPEHFHTWHSRSGPIEIAGFRVTPILTDHSAADAYMLLIERDGTRLLYTGDFRGHGRKAALVERLIANPPQDVDVLIMEGTNLRSDKPVMPEAEVEHRIAALAREVPGHVFVEWSAQNLDRTVSLYRAAKRTGRRLVVDLYTADVLQGMPDTSGIPRPGAFPALEVVITPALARYYERMGRADFVQAIIATGCATSRARVAPRPSIVMARRSLLRDFARNDALPITAADAWVHSNWSGYLDEADESGGWHRARLAGARCECIHTSGHASPALLARFAAAIAPRHLLPVHGVAWDDPALPLPPVKRLRDGEHWTTKEPAVLAA